MNLRDGLDTDTTHVALNDENRIEITDLDSGESIATPGIIPQHQFGDAFESTVEMVRDLEAQGAKGGQIVALIATA